MRSLLARTFGVGDGGGDGGWKEWGGGRLNEVDTWNEMVMGVREEGIQRPLGRGGVQQSAPGPVEISHSGFREGTNALPQNEWAAESWMVWNATNEIKAGD